MNSSNSFNICPRCGNSNTLNAKYCSRCGGELKLPEEPIVCMKCHTRNTPMANFCRNCGAELKMGVETKICTRCGREVPAENSVCVCGYSFANTLYASPIPVRADGSAADNASATDNANGGKKGKKSKDGKVYSNKGGRAFAIVAMVLLLIFAYFIIAPAKLRFDLLTSFDLGMSRHDSIGVIYGFEAIWILAISLLSGKFSDTFASYGGMAQVLISALTLVFAIAVVAHFIVCLVRAIKPKRSRKPNWLYLALALLTSIVAGLIAVFYYIPMNNNILSKIATFFLLTNEWKLGFVLYAIPAYFWFFFLYSLIAKAKVLKEQAA